MKKINEITEMSGQCVCFSLNSEEYGVPIVQVQEIIRFRKLTPVPLSNGSISGALNLRGTIIPVMDLRTRFGLEKREIDNRTRIVVVNCERTVGIVVDEVTEVITIDSDDIEPTSSFQTSDCENLVSAAAKVGDRLIFLLDIEQTVKVSDSLETAGIS